MIQMQGQLHHAILAEKHWNLVMCSLCLHRFCAAPGAEHETSGAPMTIALPTGDKDVTARSASVNEGFSPEDASCL